jgi:hypothetical protein
MLAVNPGWFRGMAAEAFQEIAVTRCRAGSRVLLSTFYFLVGTANGALAGAPSIQLQWVGTQKIEQIIGDVDWATGAPTASQTFTKSYVLGNGLGYSFEHFNSAQNSNELIFLFGDTTAFGTYSASPGLDCNATAVGAAVGVQVAPCSSPQSPPTDFRCPLGPPPEITIVPCGDSAFNFAAQDPIARSFSTDPEAGLDLEFFMNGKLPLFVTPTALKIGSKKFHIHTGGDDIPNSGITVGDKMYIVYSTGSDASCTSPCDPYAKDFSVLVRFDEEKKKFETIRELSAVAAGGNFVYTAMHDVGGGVGGIGGPARVLMFGVGDYRKSQVYLAQIPKDQFETGIGTQYLVSLNTDSSPNWTPPAKTAQEVLENQKLAQPVFPDDAPSPSVGNISVAYVKSLGLWLMTYDADGTSPPTTQGVYFRYAAAPWGKWSPPQPIFNACADGGFGGAGFPAFIHYYIETKKDKKAADCPAADPYPNGPAGPMIDEDTGANDPELKRGGSFAPIMIERFTRVGSGKLSIYYTMSTWNPYTVVKMRSDFTFR